MNSPNCFPPFDKSIFAKLTECWSSNNLKSHKYFRIFKVEAQVIKVLHGTLHANCPYFSRWL